MKTSRTPETEALYAQGLEFLRTAQWTEAVQIFSDLRTITSAYPELDALIADALLKIEIERAEIPEGSAPPRQRKIPIWLIGAVMLVLLIGGGTLSVLRSAAAQPEPTAQAAAASPSTPAPTLTVTRPTATPQPTSTPQPTALPQPTSIPEPGTITVRMADGQQTTRTIGNIEIILDASGSMLADIDGQQKIDVAHESLAALVDKLPETTSVALRTYGHRRTQDCNDVELVVPLGPLDRTALVNRINTIRPAPNSRTPMGLSLQQVVEDMKEAQGDTLVILVSDGDETCDGDPAKVAAELHASNPRLAISVIGFNVGPENWRARLSEIAQGGGGNYFDAANATQLATALEQAVTLTYRVLDTQGVAVYQGALGSAAKLPAGRYSVEINGDMPLKVGDIEVSAGGSTAVELREEGGALKATVVP
jgi:Mg-chelatase subunit ChlD